MVLCMSIQQMSLSLMVKLFEKKWNIMLDFSISSGQLMLIWSFAGAICCLPFLQEIFGKDFYSPNNIHCYMVKFFILTMDYR